MTVFRDKDRIRKIWGQAAQYLRIKRPQDLDGKTEQQPVSNQVSTPIWRKTPVLLTLGSAVLIAGAIFGSSQYIKANTVDYYHVYMNGNSIGTIDSQEQVDQLIADATAELQEEHPDYNMVLDTGVITYEAESAFKAVPESETTLAKLESMFTSHAVGVELKVDGKVIGIVKDQQTVDDILMRVQSKYAPELVADKKKAKEVAVLSYNENEASVQGDEAAAESTEEKEPGTEVVEVGFVEKVAADDIATDPSQIVAAEDVYQKLMDGGVKPTQYTVVAGDCIGCIAQKLGISQQVIYENNEWIVDDKLNIGDVLDVTMLAPELTVQTVETLVEIQPIAAPVEVQKDDSMRVGQSKVLKAGVDGSQRLTYKITKQNGYMVTEELLDKEVLVEPVPEVVLKGTKVVLGEGSGKFAWPVSNYSITSKFGKRWGRQHTGIDLIGNKSILASDAGVVEYVGTKSGTGKTIIIDHQNGYKTLYGHLSSYSVKKGEVVEKKDKIGVMGNTGNSTGVHLHFEIIKKGTKVNPLNYL